LYDTTLRDGAQMVGISLSGARGRSLRGALRA
jgi:isopropylmalate/homocitrate/citramalate synthase